MKVYECTVIIGVIAQCAVDFLNVSVLSFYRTACDKSDMCGGSDDYGSPDIRYVLFDFT